LRIGWHSQRLEYTDTLQKRFMGARFTLSIGDPGFDPGADINADGTINILDLAVTGANFQKTCPVDWP
jgi:hypothetical protein